MKIKPMKRGFDINLNKGSVASVFHFAIKLFGGRGFYGKKNVPIISSFEMNIFESCKKGIIHLKII